MGLEIIYQHMHIKVNSRTLQEKSKDSAGERRVWLSRLRRRAQNKFIIRMNLWNSEDVRGSAQSETSGI